MNNLKPIVLVILDGWGEWEMDKGNPLTKAKLLTIGELNRHYPKTFLQASGMAVGLPWGIRGNSEVGHQTLGSGQIIFQFLPAISSAIGDGSFFKNEVLLDSFNQVKKDKTNLHFLGLLSDGRVHSHIDHLFALLEMAKTQGLNEVFIHAVTDGRDTHPKSAKKYLDILQKKINEIGIGKIVTISGRYFTMDRNNNWDRIEKSFLAMTQGRGIKEKDVLEAVDNQYKKEITDEYLEPVVLVDKNDMPIGQVKSGDGIICFNFRKDRSRQITKAFVLPDFDGFKQPRPENVKFTCFTEYEKNLSVKTAFSLKKISTRLGEILSQAGKKQLRISETEKHAHVTYFFNGGLEEPFAGEERIMVPSKIVPTYSQVPEMSINEVTRKMLEAIEGEKYDFILVNFANPDMVAHTGNLKAAVVAAEFVDQSLRKVIRATLAKGGELIITADHGNIEEMVNIYTGEIDTQHSKNPVPCWYVSADSYREDRTMESNNLEIEGMLVDIAPTILELMDISRPKEMIGRSLIKVFKD